MIAALVLALALVPAPPPSYLVERVHTTSFRTERISVFLDGTVVLARSSGEGAPDVRRQRLNASEMRVLIQLVEETYPEVKAFSSTGEGPGTATVELRMAPLGQEPIDVRFPVTAVPSVDTRRVLDSLDALTTRLAGTPGDREDFSSWMPVPGETLELEDGSVVTVVEVAPGNQAPVVSVSTSGGAVIQYFDLDELRRRALRRVRP